MKIIAQAQLTRTDKASIYLCDCFADKVPAAIANVATQVAVLDTEQFQFPVTINYGGEQTAGGEKNSYVVSPLSAYTDYALDEIRRLHKPLLMFPVKLLIYAIRGLLRRAKFDAVVHINNWLLSTNPYPSAWRGEDLPQITQLLSSTYASCALAFRSLNERSNQTLLLRMEALGYLRIPSRQVYIFDASSSWPTPFLTHHNNLLDKKFLHNAPYSIISGKQLAEADFTRLEHLYNLLYLDKYCRLNPQYSAHWLYRGVASGWLEIVALRSNTGTIDGVVGWFANEHLMTAPIVGYDTQLPAATGLYRMLTQLCLQRAAERKTTLNFSSGAAHFKRLRGGEASIEYTMVYIKHLSLFKRALWRSLSVLLQAIAVPIMKKYKL